MYLGMTVTLWGGWLRASAWTFDNARRCSNTLAVVRWRSDGQTADQLHVMREALSRLDEELRRQGDDSSSGVSSAVPLRDGGGGYPAGCRSTLRRRRSRRSGAD